MTRKLPKSLHTVTVIVQLARAYQNAGMDTETALAKAVTLLQLNNLADEYDLIGAARKQVK